MITSKSPMMAKSFAIANNQSGTYINQPSGTKSGSKPQSIGYAQRVSDFGNPLTSNTVDFTNLG